MKNRVLVMGTIAADTIFNVNELPVNDGFAHMNNEYTTAGGSSANVGVALKGMGADVYQSGKIGDDKFGQILLEDFAKNQVKTDYLIVKPGGISLHTYIVVDEEGKHFIIANSGDCCMNLEEEELSEDITEHIDLFYTDLAAPRAGLALAKKCHEKGIPVVYNLQNVPSPKAGEKWEKIYEMLEYTSLFVTGRTTIQLTMKNEDTEAALNAFLKGANLPDGYICTQGCDGAKWYFEDGIERCGIIPVETIDSTGAGDAYIAGIIYSYYCQKKNRSESMQFAAAAASLKCTQAGPRLAYDEVQVKNLLKKIWR